MASQHDEVVIGDSDVQGGEGESWGDDSSRYWVEAESAVTTGDEATSSGGDRLQRRSVV